MIKLQDFYYLRHGQTDWNLAHRSMGQQDIPLNLTGIQQAFRASRVLYQRDIRTICHSPLSRAKETALILNEVLNCPMIEIDDLKECCWGTLEGTPKDDGENYRRWMRGEVPAGAEGYEEFLERSLKGINSSLEYPMPIIVAHGGTYWAILNALGRHNPNNLLPRIENCLPIYHRSPYQENEHWTVLHLEEESLAY